MSSEIKAQVAAAVKDAMRAKDKQRLGVLRTVMSEFKKVEVDERIELDDARVLAILDKLVKQRKDSATQYTDAGRPELAEIENAEIAVIQVFLPEALSDTEIAQLVQAAIEESGAQGMQDMGKVMAIVKPQVQGRADMGAVSKQVKSLLA
ncbi:GatB/YqeY domain-containing protein [Teredinibacter sp. KSP-S5-2]|uniref:GatB/YqeY domain-containing protein n=1 Tax=Teredinibacter sp. KSP-S5-2 TaxID=3034506 RepID=UPI002935303F|nr:GatB/YqeY domain-containing protein [Teredinibacter sp. KSP-S5-2]WNO08617.1 GatB/YqeY domain-containing protein [Teredinibacter sp. KSP-S5-2]